jgi:hypothetical protein
MIPESQEMDVKSRTIEFSTVSYEYVKRLVGFSKNYLNKCL